MWRLRLLLERLGRRQIAIGAGVLLAVVAAAVAAFVLLRGGDKTTTPTTTAPEPRTNLYYLRAIAPKVHVRGCTMSIRFIWKPDYHAIQYLGATAIITASGTDIAGSYKKPLTRKGLSVDVGPVSLAGGYQIWSARVTSIDGDPPGNDTTVSTAPPTGTKCS